jgi:hypothetical protein
MTTTSAPDGARSGVNATTTGDRHRRRSEMTRARVLLVAIALVALIGVGCSKAPAETSNGGGDGSATDRELAVEFAQCMHAQGVGAFRTPTRTGRAR